MNELQTGRVYNMTDAQLVLSAGSVAEFVQRDAADLSAYGISAADISALITLKNNFADFPTDEEMVGAIIGCTRSKDQQRIEVTDYISGIFTRTVMKFSSDSPLVYRMDVYNLRAQADAELFMTARRVHHVALSALDDLSDKGVTEEMLGELLAKSNNYENALHNKRKAESERMQKTRERIALGNRLYAAMSNFCEAGKSAYKNNYAKYADYVIYREPITPLPDVPLNIRYENNAVRWDAVQGATSYQLSLRASNESTAEVVYTGNERRFAFTLPNPPPDGVIAYYFSVRARNASGFGDSSDELPVNV